MLAFNEYFGSTFESGDLFKQISLIMAILDLFFEYLAFIILWIIIFESLNICNKYYLCI